MPAAPGPALGTLVRYLTQIFSKCCMNTPVLARYLRSAQHKTRHQATAVAVALSPGDDGRFSIHAYHAQVSCPAPITSSSSFAFDARRFLQWRQTDHLHKATLSHRTYGHASLTAFNQPESSRSFKCGTGTALISMTFH
jgi:hypothetical protein